VVARLKGNTVTVLDLKSGNSQLTIDMGMKIRGLRVAGSTIAVVEGEVFTWNLPAGYCTPSARANADNSVQTAMFDNPTLDLDPEVPYGSISPDFKYIAIIQGPFHSLNIYDGSTGKFLIGTKTWGKRP
jgi:hypothetical protein